VSKKEACQADLRARVLALDLAPGAVLDEVSLSASYGLSRTPFREVLQRLAGEGYLSLEAHRGAVVSSMDISAMRQFFQTAPMIYCAVARLAAEHRTAAHLEDLRAAQADFMDAHQRQAPLDMALANHRFHACIGAMSGSIYLLPSFQRLLIDHTRISQRFYTHRAPDDGTRIEQAAGQHADLIAALEARDAELAVEITLDHWALSRDEIERYVWPDALEDEAAMRAQGERAYEV
jgi:DNA-binding GntR family transcriptional regulator